MDLCRSKRKLRVAMRRAIFFKLEDRRWSGSSEIKGLTLGGGLGDLETKSAHEVMRNLNPKLELLYLLALRRYKGFSKGGVRDPET